MSRIILLFLSKPRFSDMTTLERNEAEVHREELGNLFALQYKLWRGQWVCSMVYERHLVANPPKQGFGQVHCLFEAGVHDNCFLASGAVLGVLSQPVSNEGLSCCSRRPLSYVRLEGIARIWYQVFQPCSIGPGIHSENKQYSINRN